MSICSGRGAIPEVYILILPAFGIFSEVVATFCGRPLFSYRSMVFATLGICVLSFMVWLHHFFTMGAGADVNAFFGIMSTIIAVPTGVKVFNWLFTMFRGRIVFATPMLFTVGFIVTFVIGGMTGVLLAVPPVDFVLHNSTFLVAHFHNVIIGGVLFGMLAGYNYWFPKAFGFTLDERWGKASFWCWLVGFYLAFMPLYWLGMIGMTRRLQHIPDPAWQPWLLVAEAGAIVIFCGILCQVAQLVVSIRTREQRRDLTGDPWDGRTLEWATSSPPPPYNFAVLPRVETIDAFWEMKRRGLAGERPAARRAMTDRDAAQHPDRFRPALFRGRYRLRADLADLVDGGRSACSPPLSRSWRSAGATSANGNSRPPRWRGSNGPGWPRGRPHDDNDHARRAADRTRPRARRRRTGADAHRRRLRVLDLHPERHHDVLGIVRGLRGAVGQYRRRTDRARAVQSAQRLYRDDVPVGVELHLRARRAVRRAAAERPRLSVLLCSPSRSARRFCTSRSANSPAWCARARGRRAAPSCLPSSPWSACTGRMSRPV